MTRWLLALAALLTATLVGVGPAHAAFPGRNGLIAYTDFPGCGGNACGKAELMVVRPDGTGRRALTDDRIDQEAPAFSPDGRRLLYQIVGRGIFVMNADGSGSRRVPTPTGAAKRSAFDPTWLPDGRRVGYRSGGLRLFTVDEIGLDGRGWRRLIVDALWPAWRPDGERIAFQRDLELWTAGAGGRGARRVTPAGFKAFFPDWSPDGRRIAFTGSDAYGGDGIYVIGAEGRGLRRLAAAESGDGGPAWSPDGRWIVFARGTGRTNTALWVVRADGSGAPRRITPLRGFAADPTWQPLRP